MSRKTPAKTKVLRFKAQNPFMRTSEIAKRMGYHRSYVYKILKENEQPTRIPSGLKSRHVYCAECKELVMTIKRKNRYNEKKAEKTFCSTTCKTNYFQIELTCSYCKKTFRKYKSQVKQAKEQGSENIFCGITCLYKKRSLED